MNDNENYGGCPICGAVEPTGLLRDGLSRFMQPLRARLKQAEMRNAIEVQLKQEFKERCMKLESKRKQSANFHNKTVRRLEQELAACKKLFKHASDAWRNYYASPVVNKGESLSEYNARWEAWNNARGENLTTLESLLGFGGKQ